MARRIVHIDRRCEHTALMCSRISWSSRSNGRDPRLGLSGVPRPTLARELQKEHRMKRDLPCATRVLAGRVEPAGIKTRLESVMLGPRWTIGPPPSVAGDPPPHRRVAARHT